MQEPILPDLKKVGYYYRVFTVLQWLTLLNNKQSKKYSPVHWKCVNFVNSALNKVSIISIYLSIHLSIYLLLLLIMKFIYSFSC